MATKKKAKKAAKKPAKKKAVRKIIPALKKKSVKKKAARKPAAKKAVEKKTSLKPAKKTRLALKPVMPTVGQLAQAPSNPVGTVAKAAVSPIAAWPFPTGSRP